jgi:hypothetical protein
VTVNRGGVARHLKAIALSFEATIHRTRAAHLPSIVDVHRWPRDPDQQIWFVHIREEPSWSSSHC